MVQRTALQVAGIREVRPAVVAQPEGVAVRIKAWVEKRKPMFRSWQRRFRKSLAHTSRKLPGLRPLPSVWVQGVGTEPTFRTRAPARKRGITMANFGSISSPSWRQGNIFYPGASLWLDSSSERVFAAFFLLICLIAGYMLENKLIKEELSSLLDKIFPPR